MDEQVKDLAGQIFKICRTLERVSGCYFREEIDDITFLNLFAVEHKKLNDCFNLYLGG